MPTNKKKKHLRREEKREAKVQAETDAASLVAQKPPPLPPPPPSYTATVNGLPALPDTCGFRGLGKLKGAHRTLWRMGMTLLIDAWSNNWSRTKYGEESETIHLLNLLSPHQRMRLLREVAVGLLCDETTLPSESVWHYAAYFAPLHVVLYRLLRDEVIGTRSNSPGSGEGAAAVADKREQQMAMREHFRQKRLPLKGTATRVLLKEVVRSPLDSKKRLSKWKTDLTKKCYNLVDSGSDKDRFWRKHVLCFLLESARQNHAEDAVELPDATVADFSVWESRFGASVFSSFLPDYEENAYIYMELIFGIPCNSGCTALDHLIHKVASRSHSRFEKNWKAADSAFDLRCLFLLMKEKDDVARFGYRYSSIPFLEHLHLLQNSDDKRRLCCSISAQPASRKYGPESFLNFDFNGQLNGTGTSTAFLEAMMGAALSKWTCVHLWHTEMQLNSSDYDSSDARLNAFASVSAKVSSYGEKIGFIESMWEQTHWSFTDLIDESFRPSAHMQIERGCICHFSECKIEHGIQLYCCGGCGVVSYCSKECQINDKAKHKKICKKLKKIVEKGKEACSGLESNLPNEVAASQAVSNMISPNVVPDAPITYYNSPGGVVIKGKEANPRFISFLYTNMDNDHRVKWYNLTGREQVKWIECWEQLGRPYDRREDKTRGLRGTDPGRVTDQASLEAAQI